MIEQIITFEAMEQAVSLFGSFDENIRMIEKEYNVSIVSRGSDLKIMGDAENVSRAVRAVNSLLTLINKGETLSEQNVRYVLSLVNEGNEDKLSAMTTDSICITAKGRPVKPKTLGQKKYTQAIDNNTITFGVGPAGTGKTYLAVAMAVTAFRAKEVNRIILKQVKNSAFFRAICKARSTLICARFTTHCSICSVRRIFNAIRSAALLRLLRLRICAAEHLTTAL